MHCTHLKIWQDYLGEVKIKMSERKKLCCLILKGVPWDESLFWRCVGRQTKCGSKVQCLFQSSPAQPTPLDTHIPTLSTESLGCVCWACRTHELQANNQERRSPLLFQVFHLTIQNQELIQHSQVKIIFVVLQKAVLFIIFVSIVCTFLVEG